MGKPKFFRWLWNRYPLCFQSLEDKYGPIPLPVFDTFYIDLHGIIRFCGYPIDGDIGPAIDENEIFVDICRYIDHLFQRVQPRQFCYISIDGVPPMAKVNRIRSKAYMYSKVQMDLANRARDHGQNVCFDNVGDNNALMPGSGFMDRLSDWIRYFLTCKVAEDAKWRAVNVVLSAHDIPGEGEQKIMEDIRRKYASNEYSYDTRHCIYSRDPDPLLLALTLHTPNVTIIREVIRHGIHPGERKTVETHKFHLWHLCLLREYIQLEFQAVQTAMGTRFDIERIIDDYILLAMLMGSDYVPHLPELHIHEDALDKLLEIYRNTLPTLGGYINDHGKIHFGRLETLLRQFHQFDTFMLVDDALASVNQTHTGLCDAGLVMSIRAFMQSSEERVLSVMMPPVPDDPLWTLLDKACQRLSLVYETVSLPPSKNNHSNQLYTVELAKQNSSSSNALSEDDLEEVIKYLFEYCEPCGHQEHWEDEVTGKIRAKWLQSLQVFYYKKLNVDYRDKKQLRDVVSEYAKGLQWCMSYYYHSVPSWEWYYKYRYAPRIIDLVNLDKLSFEFELGAPLDVYEFAMLTLPSFSYRVVPYPYQFLMRDPDSPIIDFYPNCVEFDFNGKLAQWEAVIHLPPIDLPRIRKALDEHRITLSYKERMRREQGRLYSFKYSSTADHFIKSSIPDIFSNKRKLHCKCEIHDPPLPLDWNCTYKLPKSKKEGRNSLSKSAYYTLNSIPIDAKLVKGKELAKHWAVGYMRMTLTVSPPIMNTNELAERYIGKRVIYGWPYGRRGCVVSVADEYTRYEWSKEEERIIFYDLPTAKTEELQRNLPIRKLTVEEEDAVILGGKTPLVWIRPLKEIIRNNDGTLTYKYDKSKECTHPIHYIIAEDSEDTYEQNDDIPIISSSQSIEKRFPLDSNVFFLGNSFFGYPCRVAKHHETTMTVHFNIAKMYYIYPDKITKLILERRNKQKDYIKAAKLASNLNLSPKLLSQLTSCILVEDKTSKRRFNVGLYFKSHTKRLKLDGYTRFNQREWEYSPKAYQNITDYINTFPDLIKALKKCNNTDNLSVQSLFPEDIAMRRVNEIMQWKDQQEWKKLPLISIYDSILDKETISQIEKLVANAPISNQKMDPGPLILHDVTIEQVLQPEKSVEYLADQRFRLGDRIIHLYDGHGGPPIATQGTVVGYSNTFLDILLDHPYVCGKDLNERCSPHRAIRLPKYRVINQTYRQVVNNVEPLITTTDTTSSMGSKSKDSKETSDPPVDALSHLLKSMLITDKKPNQASDKDADYNTSATLYSPESDNLGALSDSVKSTPSLTEKHVNCSPTRSPMHPPNRNANSAKSPHPAKYKESVASNDRQSPRDTKKKQVSSGRSSISSTKARNHGTAVNTHSNNRTSASVNRK